MDTRKTPLAVILFMQVLCVSSEAEQIETNWQPYVTAKPDPVIPQTCLRQGQGGSGLFQLAIDPRNGVVTEVKVLKHTGYQRLDAAAVMMFLNWRFRPGTITHAKITYQLGVYGRSRSFHSGRY